MTNILKGYKRGMKYKEEVFNKMALNSKKHEHNKMLNFAKENLLINKKVKFDSFLEGLLHKSY